jgi:subtilisin family serine protease
MTSPQPLSFFRRPLLFLAAALAILLGLCFAAMHGTAQTTATSPVRVLVKMRSSLAKDVESALPIQTMEVIAGQSGNARVDAFLLKHAAHKARPLYPGIVRAKKQRGLSDLQIATLTRQKYALRATRLHASFQPPEISRTYVLELDSGSQPNLKKAVSALQADPDVEFAEEDKIAKTSLIPNDPYLSSTGSWGQPYDDLWGIKKIGAPAAWDTTTGSGLVVAVVDTGVDYNHPDIAANVWTNPNEIPGNGIDDDGNGYIDDLRGWNFVANNNDPMDDNGHGTHVAGTIAAVGNNGIGVIGVAWGASVMPVKALDSGGSGYDSQLGPAIIYAANNGADVISNSWGGPGTSQTIADAVDYAHNMGAVVVAAAGNSSDNARNYFPANLPNVITVAASAPDDTLAWFSNFGSKIDVAAPGVDILSLQAAGTSMGTTVSPGYTRASGTSMATPHVSGIAALILSQHPEYSNEQVRQVIRGSATDLGTPGFDLSFGYGGANAAAALSVTNPLEAHLTNPVGGTVIQGAVTFSGVARGTGFTQYTLDYGSGSLPTSWTVFQTSSTPTSGPLGAFDGCSISDGVYTFRLTAYNSTGGGFADRVVLVVRCASITSPVLPRVPTSATTFKTGMSIPITGTALASTFENFQVDWAMGINPDSGWQTSGITLAGGGMSPVSNGPLASWGTPTLGQAEYCTIRLIVTASDHTSESRTFVYLEPDLLTPSWPEWINQGPYFNSGVVPAFNADGSFRLLVAGDVSATMPSALWTLSPDGSTISESSLPPPGYGSFHQPSAADLDGIGGDEAIVADGGNIRIFPQSGSSTTFTPDPSVPFWNAFINSELVVEDLNGDSHWETFALGEDFDNNVAYVVVWGPDGQPLKGNFPIQVSDANDIRYSYNHVRFLVGDIDGDGRKEIVVLEGLSSSTYTLSLFGNDGTRRSWGAPVLEGMPWAMVLADLDHNGKLETILVSQTANQVTLHVIQPDGSERPGWPVILPNTSQYNTAFLAVGNLGRDGHEEIVLSHMLDLYVFTADGTPYSAAWPLPESANIYGAVVLGDIDGDGFPEIVLPSINSLQCSDPWFEYCQPNYGYLDQKLLAFRRDGTLAKSWQLNGMDGYDAYEGATPTIGDFNQDGITDVAVAYEVTGPGDLLPGVVTVLTTGTPFNASANDWPMIFQNPRNTAVYHPLLSVSITSPSAGTNVYGVVSVTASAPDKVAVPTVQLQLDGTSLGAAVTAAPYTVTWDTSTASLGSHVLTASASDASGNSAVSPPISVNVILPPTFLAFPASLNFGGEAIGSTSSAQTITVTNSNQATYSISSVNVSGDFAQSSNCIGSLAAGASCSINVTFTPTVRGAETGTLTMSGNFPGSNPTVTLSGTGQLLAASLTPSSLAFPPQLVSSTSTAQTLTYSNTGDLPVSISGISVTGDFAETSTCGASLSAGTNCSISVTFTPTARGTRTGTFSITGNINSSAVLTGTGQASAVSISPTSLNFGSLVVGTTSAPQNVTITNTGDLPFYVMGPSYGSPLTVTTNCPLLSNIDPGMSCIFSVTFTASTTLGYYQGTFSIPGSFPGAPANIVVSGTSLDTAAVLSATSLSFSDQPVNTTSSPESTTLVNTANTPVIISSIQATGDFTQTNNCHASLAVASSCTINVRFHPSAIGARSGSLTVSANTRIPIVPTALSGIGTGPALSFSPLGFTGFGSQKVNTTSAAQTLTMTNTGNAPLTITGFTITANFKQSNTCGTSLAAGANCSVSVTFAPKAQGNITGSLTLNSNLPGSTPSFALSGKGTASAASLSTSALSYASQVVGTTSSPQSVTLTNSGNATLAISGISASGDFAQTNNCPASLGVGANCPINVSFTPAAIGTRTGTLTISDDALAGSPQIVSLTGTGITLKAAFNVSLLTYSSQRVGTTSAAQIAKLTNTGTTALSISGFSLTGDFAQSNNCPGSLAPGANCTVSLTFIPTARGARSGTLTVNSNAMGTPPSIALTGTGVAPVAALSSTSLTFSNQSIGTTSAAKSVALTNSGDATLNISGVSTSGDFSHSGNCGTTLAAGTSCILKVSFTPTATGTRTGVLTVVDDAFNGSPQTTSLSGTGVDFSLSSSPTSITVNSGSSAAYTVTVSPLGGSFSSSVGLSCSSGLPKGTTCSFSPSSVTPGSTSATSHLTISTTKRSGNNGTPAGTYTVTLRGISGSTQHSVLATLKVN